MPSCTPTRRRRSCRRLVANVQGLGLLRHLVLVAMLVNELLGLLHVGLKSDPQGVLLLALDTIGDDEPLQFPHPVVLIVSGLPKTTGAPSGFGPSWGVATEGETTDPRSSDPNSDRRRMSMFTSWLTLGGTMFAGSF